MAMTSALSGDLLDRALTLRELGKSCAYIKWTLKIDLSVGAIEWQMMRAGIFPPGRVPPGLYRRPARISGPRRTVRSFTLEEDCRLLSLDAAGEPVNRIAAALGRGSSSVRGRLLTLARYEALEMLPPELTAAIAGQGGGAVSDFVETIEPAPVKMNLFQLQHSGAHFLAGHLIDPRGIALIEWSRPEHGAGFLIVSTVVEGSVVWRRSVAHQLMDREQVARRAAALLDDLFPEACDD